MKTVFVQARDKDARAVARMLGSIEQTTYQFVVLPMDTKLLSKELLIELIESLK